MVTPVTGPIAQTFNHPKFYRVREVWKQTMPIDRALPYSTRSLQVMSQTGNEANKWADAEFDSNLGSNSLINMVRIRAYDDLKSKLGDAAQLAVTVREYKQSLDAITQNAQKLLWLAVALKKRWNNGPLPSYQGHRPKVWSRDVSSTWLSYSFGLAPTYQDIYNSVQILQNPLKDQTIRGSKWANRKEQFSLSGQPSFSRILLNRRTEVRVIYGTKIRVTNYNLHLADQLGILNPASFLWERTKFSFVLDWFTNVGQFLALGTDFAGITLVDPFTTTRVSQSRYYVWTNYGWLGNYRQDDCIRQTGIVTPSLGVKQLRPWGWQRAANAVSLLVNCLKSF